MKHQQTYANDEDMYFTKAWKLIAGKRSRARMKKEIKKRTAKRERQWKEEE